MGYDAPRMLVIENGVDTERFRPSDRLLNRVYAEHSISPDAPTLGMLTRFDSIKDHRTFFNAAAALLRHVPNAQLVLCGEGMVPENAQLAEMSQEAGVASADGKRGLEGKRVSV